MASGNFQFNASGSDSFSFYFPGPGQTEEAKAQKAQIPRLPAELWHRAFKFVPWSTEGSLGVRELLSVCHSWKAIGEPVLYNDISIKTEARLHALSSRIIRSRDPKGQTVGRWIHFLELCVEDVTMALPCLILCHLPNLKTFICQVAISYGLVGCLAQSASASLTELQLLHVTDMSPDMLATINHFKNLTRLYLVLKGKDVCFPDIPLSLPRVSIFHLVWAPKPDSTRNGVSALARSRFHRSCNLQLNLPTLSREDAISLSSLLPPHAADSWIALNAPDEAVIALAEGIKLFSNIYFLHNVPPSAFVEVGALPACLSIMVPLLHMDKLWALLTSLAARPDPSSTSMELNISLSSPNRKECVRLGDTHCWTNATPRVCPERKEHYDP